MIRAVSPCHCWIGFERLLCIFFLLLKTSPKAHLQIITIKWLGWTLHILFSIYFIIINYLHLSKINYVNMWYTETFLLGLDIKVKASNKFVKFCY